MFKDDVAPIDVPEVSKTFEKARVIRPFFSSTTCMPKNTNSGNPAGLRTRKAWQRRYRTADGCKEITSSHRLRLNHISPSDQSTPPTEPRCVQVAFADQRSANTAPRFRYANSRLHRIRDRNANIR